METRTSGTASFLGLPQELRIQIYEELRCATSGEVYLLHDEIFAGLLQRFHTSVLLTNRQIHEEAREVFHRKSILALRVSYESDSPVRLRKTTPLSACTGVRVVQLIFMPHRSITEMGYNTPKDGDQVLLVNHAKQICNMLSTLPTIESVRVTEPCCHGFQPFEDLQEVESQLLHHRLAAALEPLMSLPIDVTIQCFDPFNKELDCTKSVPLVSQTFARCVNAVISARARLREGQNPPSIFRAEELSGCLQLE